MDSSVNRWLRIILLGGFSALFLVALILSPSLLTIALAVILLAGIALTLTREFTSLSKPLTIPYQEVLAFLLGVVVTFGLHVVFSWPVVLASAVVGLVGFVLLKEYATALFAGSFLGMSDVLLLSEGWLVLASVIAVIAYFIFKPVLIGFGGKLGWVAWMGSVSVFLIRFESFEAAARIAFDPLIFFSGVILFGLATFWLKNHRLLDAVAASAILGLVLGGIEGTVVAGLSVYVIPWYGATFVGMSSNDRFHSKSLIIALLLYGTLFYLIHPYYPLTGGKLGALSFVSTLVVWGTLQLFKKKP